ncbi:uncharacterized protein LOC114574224 [Exaiptasia diaphana]|uniref:Uncharacterized protein n=1 Tax=Exaiptasia diaphana TaxID=2652724 RepID=A0A913X561_EXADI|nr:uncharacterized protein LOC114574224 [Exaiptasia diaphana]
MASCQEGLRVTLSIFSGRPDPSWHITPSNEHYEKITTLLNDAKKAGYLRRMHEMPSRLGYRGFVVGENLVIGQETNELQKLLVCSAPDNVVSSPLKEKILAALADNSS